MIKVGLTKLIRLQEKIKYLGISEINIIKWNFDLKSLIELVLIFNLGNFNEIMV